MCLDILIKADLSLSSYGSVSRVWGFYSLPHTDLCRASCPRERCTGAEFLPLVNYLLKGGPSISANPSEPVHLLLGSQ